MFRCRLVKTVFIFAFAVLAVVPFRVSLAVDEQAAPVERLVVGRISFRTEQALRDVQAMTAYLRHSLPNGEKMVFGEVVVPTLDDMASLLKEGKVDLVSETPLGALALVERAGAEIVLHEWKKGVSQYASMIVTHRESSIKSLDALKGKVVAFEDPGSTSGFLLPLAILKAQGIRSVELANRNDTPPKDVVGYIFTGHEINAASLVARRVVDAGALSNLNWWDDREVPPGFRERLSVLHLSDPVPRSTVLVRAGLSPALKTELITQLLAMDQTPAGRSAMAAYHGVRKFAVIGTDFERQMKTLRTLYASIEAYLN